MPGKGAGNWNVAEEVFAISLAAAHNVASQVWPCCRIRQREVLSVTCGRLVCVWRGIFVRDVQAVLRLGQMLRLLVCHGSDAGCMQDAGCVDILSALTFVLCAGPWQEHFLLKSSCLPVNGTALRRIGMQCNRTMQDARMTTQHRCGAPQTCARCKAALCMDQMSSAT